MRSSSVKLNDFDLKRMGLVMAVTIAFVLLCFLWRFPSPKPHLQGCGTTRIWSHRGHFDSATPKKSCAFSLNKIAKANIRHYDIDVMLIDGVATVAHPADYSKDLGALASPCSRLSLAKLLHRLEDVYGRDYFFLTIEPKVAWTPDKASDLLLDPELVMTEILNVLELENTLDPDNCGMIIEPKYYANYPTVTKRLPSICRQTATPYRYGPDFASLDQQVLPTTSTHKILMPNIEHFAGFRNTEFLHNSNDNMHVVTWLIDTKEQLQSALELPHIDGVISNYPLDMARYYKELCDARYDPSFV